MARRRRLRSTAIPTPAAPSDATGIVRVHPIGPVIWRQLLRYDAVAKDVVLCGYITYDVVRITAKYVYARDAFDHIAIRLDRTTLEREGMCSYSNRRWEHGGRYVTTRSGNVYEAASLTAEIRDAARQTLGLPETFTPEDARLAFRRLANTCHPDRGGTHEEFVALQAAYDQVLTPATLWEMFDHLSDTRPPPAPKTARPTRRRSRRN